MTLRDYAWGLALHLVGFVVCAWLALCTGLIGDYGRASILGGGALVVLGSLFRFELHHRRQREGWPFTCTRCGYDGFRSKGGRLVSGTCPNPIEVDVPIEDGTFERATTACPLVPAPWAKRHRG